MVTPTSSMNQGVKLQYAISVVLIHFIMIHSVALGQEAVAPKEMPVGDGVVLHYVERGKGDPIIFIHGLMSDYSFWMRQLDGFPERVMPLVFFLNAGPARI